MIQHLLHAVRRPLLVTAIGISYIDHLQHTGWATRMTQAVVLREVHIAETCRFHISTPLTIIVGARVAHSKLQVSARL